MPQPRRRLRALALTPLITAALVIGGLAPAAHAAPEPWSAAGPGSVTLVSDGVGAPAQFSYDGGTAFNGTWTFSSTAPVTGTVTVPYTWNGIHSWFAARASLSAFDDDGSTVLVNQGASDSFGFSGSHTFTVTAGETYGFRVGGSHADSALILRGTFTLGALQVTQADTITFVAPTGVTMTSDVVLSATAASALPVTFQSLTPGTCAVTGSDLSPVAAGACTIEATTAGDATYLASSATASFAIALAADTIAAPPTTEAEVGKSLTLASTTAGGVAITHSSLTPSLCTVDSATIAFTGVGECRIAAESAGNATFEAATGVLVFAVSAAPVVAGPVDPVEPEELAQLPVTGAEVIGWGAAASLLLAIGLGLMGVQRTVRRTRP
ncbi:hypothetical protein FVA74_13235 [Salinibacterium sp. dk2585]|uniref:hypothetical protein n=1 Tax=unclassified Salinibacterium TaxID=2632331 RepID=UPI0011C242B4|nr:MULTISPECIES: hypothetical protein [unclassified Salinibacterium]QEE62427.1 hypothetical protein FVA74_13235 [Salinibacterium sp. dk2585]TXK52690.1 hypothetical protein FVP63_12160 [Salinibacterium sp. dk5596]